MEVLLRRDVKNLGQMGDVVEVADGYARNYLLPREMALEVVRANLEALRRAREARQERDREERQSVEELAQQLNGFLCYIQVRATEEGHLYGSVGPEEVVEALAESGFETIRPANIVMPLHFEEVGDYELEVMLHPELAVHITLRVAPLEEEESGC